MPIPPLFSSEWDSDFLGLLCIACLFVALASIGAVLVIRDTIRQRGRWGINFKLPICKQCGTQMPMVRKPTNLRQALWGGWRCPECGLELDKWGQLVEGQVPGKWAVLRAVEEIEERRHQRQRDERIQNVNDRTQRGEAS